MKEKIDIYNFSAKLDYYVRTVKTSELSDKNKELILSFKDYMIAQGISIARVIRYVGTLKKFGLYLNMDFDVLEKKDVQRLISFIQQSKYCPHTRHTYKCFVKRFYKWLKGDDEYYPDLVRWIQTGVKDSELKKPREEDLITEEDVLKVIDACLTLRDKALIAVLYETGCRVGELLTLQIFNVNFDNMGAQVTLKGKTGTRRVRIVWSTRYLMN